MIVAIRIRGRVGLRKPVNDTLERLRLRKKYVCSLFNENPVNLGMINSMRDFIAFGTIDEETLEALISSRGQKIDKSQEIDSKKVAKDLLSGKKFKDLNLKPFFRLHPPRGGIDSKVHFPKGVLGDNKEKINELLRRML